MTDAGKMDLAEKYFGAKEAVIRQGYAHEIDWQDSLCFDDVTETDLLREGAWVILSSGMREAVIVDKFPGISTAFFQWDSAKNIIRHMKSCRRRAMRVFGHAGKIDAIIELAARVARDGFDQVVCRIRHEGPVFLQTFSYLGPATSLHLAKNLGLNVVKPDRHLKRVANAVGFDSPDELCAVISRITGEAESLVDLVIWRFATLASDYISHFCGKVPA